MSPTDDLYSSLGRWASGDLALEAAVHLLGTAHHGRLLAGPWVRRGSSGEHWFDADLAVAEGAYLSGGERRVLLLAASLASEAHPVDLGAAITGVDPDALQHVLEALAHAGGSASTVSPGTSSAAADNSTSATSAPAAASTDND